MPELQPLGEQVGQVRVGTSSDTSGREAEGEQGLGEHTALLGVCAAKVGPRDMYQKGLQLQMRALV